MEEHNTDKAKEFLKKIQKKNKEKYSKNNKNQE